MKRLKLILAGLLISAGAFAQTGIGTTTPDASAQLDVSSTYQRISGTTND